MTVCDRSLVIIFFPLLQIYYTMQARQDKLAEIIGKRPPPAPGPVMENGTLAADLFWTAKSRVNITFKFGDNESSVQGDKTWTDALSGKRLGLEDVGLSDLVKRGEAVFGHLRDTLEEASHPGWPGGYALSHSRAATLVEEGGEC